MSVYVCLCECEYNYACVCFFACGNLPRMLE